MLTSSNNATKDSVPAIESSNAVALLSALLCGELAMPLTFAMHGLLCNYIPEGILCTYKVHSALCSKLSTHYGSDLCSIKSHTAGGQHLPCHVHCAGTAAALHCAAPSSTASMISFHLACKLLKRCLGACLMPGAAAAAHPIAPCQGSTCAPPVRQPAPGPLVSGSCVNIVALAHCALP